jgi:hypothetical protein
MGINISIAHNGFDIYANMGNKTERIANSTRTVARKPKRSARRPPSKFPTTPEAKKTVNADAPAAFDWFNTFIQKSGRNVLIP